MNKQQIRFWLLPVLCIGLILGIGNTPGLSPTKATAAEEGKCGQGDHGLLQNLKRQRAGADQDPLKFSDIDFLSTSTGRAAGNGFLIGTSDSGCHWQEIYTGQWQFEQIDFSDNVKGWALARAGKSQNFNLIRTKDGGSKWANVYTAGQSLQRIDVHNAETVVGYTRNAVYVTKNGGNAWARIPTPANTRAALFPAEGGLKRGWAMTVKPGGGIQLMKTVDGGRHWRESLAASGGIGGEIYSSGEQVWALVRGESGMSQVSYSLYASADDGKNWTRVIAQSTAGGGPAPGSGKAVAERGPANPGGHPGNLVIADGAVYLAGGSPAAGKVGLGRSFNGGKTWSNVPATLAGFDAKIAFPAKKTGWLAVTNPDDAAIYLTKDGGVSWNIKFDLNGK